MPVMLGGEATVSTKCEVAVSPPSSVTVSVMVARPVCPVADVTVTERVAPTPAKTILAVGTSVVLLEHPAIVSNAVDVRSSPTVNANAAVDVPALID